MQQVRLSKGLFALIDDEDFERVNALKWCASFESRGTKWYAIRFEKRDGKQVKMRLHHFVLGIPPQTLGRGEVIDHKNHNSLDCRKENLERISQRMNMLRSPGWKRRKHL